ncbi:unnamed protein product, partial [Owenia fusiformis]
GRAVFLLLTFAICTYLGQGENDASVQIGMLARQLMLQQFYVEERIRSDGHSGVKQTRYMATGTKSYYSNTHVHTGGVAAIHEHANNKRTVGMGEFTAVMNGVEFRTRHNDYSLRMPSPNSTDYNDNVDIPFPKVPPAVLSKPDIESQSEELREWFKAWRDDDFSVRDFRPYFKPVLCYLEGGWTTSTSDKIDEPFKSDRHFIDATIWSELMEKVMYTSYTGSKSRLENLAYLPVKIMNFANDTTPIFAQWNYRIMCHPIKRHVPLHAFHLVDDIKTRKMRQETTEKLSMSRKARFQINHILSNKKDYQDGGSKRSTLLDELMYEVPGKENYRGTIKDTTLDGNIVKREDGSTLNAAYYHRFFKVAEKDAMGEALHRRGFSDDNLFMAKTTQPKIASMEQTVCRRRKCVTETSRWTYAFPLEIIYLTPLNSWNPYKLEYKGDAKSEAGMTVTAGKRNGALNEAKAYNGTNRKLYYITPNEFFQNTQIEKTNADTARGSVGVLDGNGVMRKVKAAGTRIFFPEIPDVGRLRQRYPIMPIHAEGSTIYKNLEALTDIVMDLQDNMELLRKPLINEPSTHPKYEGITLGLTTATKNIGPHVHSVELTAKDVEDTMNGKRIIKDTSEAAGHTHRLKIVYKGGKWLAVRCDNKAICWDGHGKELEVIE